MKELKDPIAASPHSLKDGVNPQDNKGIQPRSGGAGNPGKASSGNTEPASYKSV